jgi:hypothetical protein
LSEVRQRVRLCSNIRLAGSRSPWVRYRMPRLL